MAVPFLIVFGSGDGIGETDCSPLEQSVILARDCWLSWREHGNPISIYSGES
ncbi:hypothetical protein [Brenneria roseae]|uniref:hypothetical protein n=1 Tax=Brenneria roseae TaxID=1509241 RepID=UPI00147431D2|nr:hypothetical protein [Brenneria roseae]